MMDQIICNCTSAHIVIFMFPNYETDIDNRSNKIRFGEIYH